MTDFKTKYGPWALVAGASEGLGAAFSIALASKGMNLILIARRKDKLDALARQITSQYSVEVVTHRIDLSDFNAVKSFISQLRKNSITARHVHT